MNAITCTQVSKTFKDIRALDNVSVSFEEGKIYGLLGRNGAGKTTLLNCITGRLFPTGGEIRVDGELSMENEKALRKLFYMGQQELYPEEMTVQKVFTWTKLIYGGFDMEYAHALCEKFGLNPKKKTSKLSTGYRSIYKLITALAVDVPYLLLDEPVLGLDAGHREMFYRELLESYGRNPRTIVLSTHLIEEAASLLEEVIILHNGKVMCHKTCEKLLNSGYTVSGKQSEVDAFIAGKQVLSQQSIGGLKTAVIYGQPEKDMPKTLETGRMDLQKLFVAMTEENGRDFI